MQVNTIQYRQNTRNQTFTYNKNSKINIIQSNAIQNDIFVKQLTVSNQPNLNFTGKSIKSKLIGSFLRNMCYKRSIRGSKRPYISLSDELKNITKEITIPVSKTESINALDINPKNSNKYIIFFHGFSHNITSNQELYKALTKSDYGILAIDYRGYGRNKPSKHVQEKDFTHDAIEAVNYLNAKGIKDIGIIGHSFGGYVAAKTSKLKDVSFQILVAPLTSLEFWLRNVLKHPKKYNTEMFLIKHIPGFKQEYREIFNINQHLQENLTPTYIIQSKHDRYIKIASVNRLTRHIPNLKNYTILQTGGHRMDENKIEKITEIIKNL